MLNVIFQIHVPHKSENFTNSSINEISSSQLTLSASSSSLSSKSNTPLVVIPSIYEVNIFRSLLPIISHIQLVWELVLTCEPLIVMAPTPDVSSEVVQTLISMIWPLKFFSDFRPFFTIHDSEFREYTKKSQAP